MNSRALSGTARLLGCDVEVSASQAGSRRATNFNLQSGNSHGAPSCRINLQCGKAPESPEAAERLRELAKLKTRSFKPALVSAFKEFAALVGVDKAKLLLATEYGAEEPEELKSSQLMDAIDSLYGG